MGNYFNCAHTLKVGIINQQGQEILQNDNPDTPTSSVLLRWLMVMVISGLVLGGGYWYYSRFIVPSVVTPSPSPEITEAVWKTKSEKVVNDFLNYWQKSAQNNGDEQAKKARDLMSINAQAKLETLKNSSGQPYLVLKDKLTAFLGLDGITSGFKISNSRKIDEKTVEITVVFSFSNTNQSVSRVLTTLIVDNIWLVDAVRENSVLASPSPSPTPTPSPTSSPSPGLSPSPSISP